MKMILPLFPLLYAETHYTFKGFSLIYRPWPEIVTDAPYRVEPGTPIPILVLFRDAHRFPVRLHSITAILHFPDGNSQEICLHNQSILIHQPSWYTIFPLEIPKGVDGLVKIDVRIEIEKSNKKRIVQNHNYPFRKPSPLEVFIAKEPFPQLEGWKYFDLHHHSEFTSDQVEFGAPLHASAVLGMAMGLSGAGITDHSYDLDDREDRFDQKDPELTRWKNLWRMCEAFEKELGFVFVPGEELSCGNHQGKNIHLLVFNSSQFYAGTGDSAEIWFHTKPEFLLPNVLDTLAENGLAFAAHPEFRFHWLQRLLLSRGHWQEEDYTHPRLNGLEILNGPADASFWEGLKVWIRFLLQGRKWFIIAGNDAHGAFNRTFQLGLPFLYVKEKRRYIFGQSKTGLYVNKKPSRDKVLEALGKGHCFITTGPACIIEAETASGQKTKIGEEMIGSKMALTIRGKTSLEYGNFESIRVLLGDLDQRKEILLKEFKEIKEKEFFHTLCLEDLLPSHGYVRAEATTCLLDGQRFFSFTNPIWFSKKP